MNTDEAHQKEVASDDSDENAGVQRRGAERIRSRARLELTRRGCRMVKPVAGEIVLIPFPRNDLPESAGPHW